MICLQRLNYAGLMMKITKDDKFSELTQLINNSSPDHQKWLGTAVAGVIVADGIIDGYEKPYLKANLPHLLTDAGIREILRTKTTPELQPLDLPPRTARHLLKCLLDICAADGEIHPDELAFVHHIASVLSVSVEEVEAMQGASS